MFGTSKWPHTFKLSFSGFLKNFYGNWQITQGLKWNYLRMKLRNPLWEIFSERVRRRTNLEERFWFDGNDFFCSNPCNGIIITENIFTSQNEPHRAKLKFFRYFEVFLRKLTKKLYLRTKKWLSQREAKNSTKRNFSKRVWKGENLEEMLWFDGNNFFVQTSEMVQLHRKLLLHKISHIQ